ncbi:hypothetical protein BDY19DRAFT_909796 [Irpex rosettiformis]|uniref:Uncharacterized protein n=1 Tax=Irpex rosettiformis TaxID=378272 RepID=A0ACB8TR53_9APHY|nr:hypothetical protein BDY19DRAFT_909796 [Irpex rosettiformis]
MVSAPTPAQIHTKALSKLSWPWLIWVIIALLSFTGMFLVCVAIRPRIIRRARTAVAVRETWQEEAKLILPTHTDSYSPIPFVESPPVDESIETKISHPAILVSSLQGPRHSSTDRILIQQVQSDGIVDTKDITKAEIRGFGLLHPPETSLASRSPDALARILDYHIPSQETPPLSPVSLLSSVVDSPLPGTPGSSLPSLLTTNNRDKEEVNPVEKDVCSDDASFEIFDVTDLANVADTGCSRRKPARGPPSVPALKPPESTHCENNINDVLVDDAKAAKRHSLRERDPDVTRTPEQVVLMTMFGLDYIDARIATITGHSPSPVTPLRSSFHSMYAFSPSLDQKSSSRRPLSLPILYATPTTTRKYQQENVRYLSGGVKLSTASTPPPRRLSQSHMPPPLGVRQNPCTIPSRFSATNRSVLSPVQAPVGITTKPTNRSTRSRVPLGTMNIQF